MGLIGPPLAGRTAFTCGWGSSALLPGGSWRSCLLSRVPPAADRTLGVDHKVSAAIYHQFSFSNKTKYAELNEYSECVSGDQGNNAVL